MSIRRHVTKKIHLLPICFFIGYPIRKYLRVFLKFVDTREYLQKDIF